MRRLTMILLLILLPTMIHAGAPSATLPEVKRLGKGPETLLLIPCMSCRWESWQGFMEKNSSRYTMYAVTLPGFGGTPVPDIPMYTDGTPWRDNALAALSRLIDDEKLERVTVVGHSFGTMVAVQLAAKRPDAVKRLIAVDGSIESKTWTPQTPEERLAEARKTVEEWRPRLDSAEEWQKFNSVGLPAGDTVERDRALEAIRRHGSFMATPRDVLLQYWRENLLIDLTPDLAKLEIPILDVKALGVEPEPARTRHLKDLAEAGVPSNVKTVFMYLTSHFAMVHRPEALSEIVAAFIAGEEVRDFHPER